MMCDIYGHPALLLMVNYSILEHAPPLSLSFAVRYNPVYDLLLLMDAGIVFNATSRIDCMT